MLTCSNCDLPVCFDPLDGFTDLVSGSELCPASAQPTYATHGYTVSHMVAQVIAWDEFAGICDMCTYDEDKCVCASERNLL